MNFALKKRFIIFITFLGVTAHTGDAVENDGVSCFDLINELFPSRSLLRGSRVEFSNNDCFGVKFCNIGNLTGDALMLGGHTTMVEISE